MKNLSKILFTVFIILFQIVGVNALSVDENNLTIEKGKNKSIDIYANVESEVTSIEFTMVYTTYDVPAYFIVNNSYTDTNPDGIKHNIVLNEPTSGKIKLGTININVVNNPKDTVGTINIHSGTAKTNNSESIKLNAQNINVSIVNKNQQQDNNSNIEENEVEETHNLLERIESEIVKIELKEDLFEYEVATNKEITELDLKPIPKEDSSKIEISSQKIEELEDNNIIIKVTNGNIKQEYKIKINILKDLEKIEIDTEGSKSTYKYKGKWIVAIIVLGIMMFIGLILNRKK